MKKLCICVAVAVAIVATCTATAMASTTISGPGTVAPGTTVNITVNTDAEALAGNVLASGLEVESVSAGFSTAGSVVIMKGLSAGPVTYACRVTAQAGQNVSFGLGDAVESNAADEEVSTSVTPWTATVASVVIPPSSEVAVTSPDPEATTITNRATPAPSAAASEPAGRTTRPSDPSEVASASGAPSSSASQPGPSQDQADIPASPSASPSGMASTGVAGGSTASTGPSTSSGIPGGYPKTADASLNLWMMFGVACVCAAVAVLAARKAFNNR